MLIYSGRAISCCLFKRTMFSPQSFEGSFEECTFKLHNCCTLLLAYESALVAKKWSREYQLSKWYMTTENYMTCPASYLIAATRKCMCVWVGGRVGGVTQAINTWYTYLNVSEYPRVTIVKLKTVANCRHVIEASMLKAPHIYTIDGVVR